MSVEDYESLFTLNQALQSILLHLEKLKASGLLPEAFVRVRQLKLEEIRAEINMDATIRLHTREVNSNFFHQQGRVEEKESPVLQDPAAAPKQAS